MSTGLGYGMHTLMQLQMGTFFSKLLSDHLQGDLSKQILYRSSLEDFIYSIHGGHLPFLMILKTQKMVQVSYDRI